MSVQDARKVAAADRTTLSDAGHPVKNNRFVAEGIVAFSAMKSASQGHLGVNQNIIFEQVLTNEGGGYHPNHGVFIAPQSGVYVMSSAIMTSANGRFHAAIVHNGNMVAHIYGHGDSGLYDQGSQTIVIKLNAEDEVAVQNFDFPDITIFGYLYSSFSGYLLWQP
ncbi:cerebellin-3-like [Dreissena polymorpha]|uniref:C1q domain-containing protein n=1 Tax=Dreissena polymorpha TaxID=45954 RepID=A0A9D4J107_DREPO|nr:cerebellin-3-like [Dreissena polymorpha]KAH3791914.1 hypothetical protein DPMN_145404 [Dreissena polymorpha]